MAPSASKLAVWGFVYALLVPVAVTIGGILIRLSIPGTGYSFLYLPATGVVAYAYGPAAGAVAAALSVVLGWAFLIGPAFAFAVSAPAAVTMVLFVLSLAAVWRGLGHLSEQREADELAARTRSRLAHIVESSSDPILSKTLDGIILTWNGAAARLYGYAAAEAVGRHVAMLAPPERAPEIADIMERLRRREHIVHLESVRVKKDGTPFEVELTISPIRDSAGRVIGGSTITRDVSERKRAERNRRLLDEATEILTRSLDVRATVDSLATLTVEALADACVITLAGAGRLEHTFVARGGGEEPRAVRHVDAACPEAAPCGPARVIETGRAELHAHVSWALLEAVLPEGDHRDALARLRPQEALIVPLTARGRTLGAMTWIAGPVGPRYERDDEVFARALADRAALAVDNAQLHRSAQQDRAAAQRAADRIGRLQAATAALSEAATSQQVAEVTTDHAVSSFGAEAAALSLLATDGVSLELVRAVGYPAELTNRWRHFQRQDIPAIADAMLTGQVVWHASKGAMPPRLLRRESLPESIDEGARAAIPLMTHGRAVGALYLNFRDPYEFDRDDLDFMLTLGRLCAQALERARLYEQEHRVAETLQHAFLPAALPQIPGVMLHAAYRPGTDDTALGGDWYDVFQLPDGRVALSIGDVVGHGLHAAVVMGQVRQSVRAAALEDPRPAGVLRRASEVLRLTYSPEGMATALFGLFDPAVSTFTYASAGHPPPALLGAGRHAEMLAAGGVPLGYIGIEDPPSHSVTLEAGSLLAFYTDGLTENARDPIAGEAALLEALRREAAAPSANHAEALVDQVLGDRDAADDIAVITLALRSVPLEEFELILPAEPPSAPLMRQALRKLIAAVGGDDQEAAAITVATGEAVNNAIEHAYGVARGVVRVRARYDGTYLRVDVEDDGVWRPGRAPDGGGHGLALMKALIDTVDVTTSPTGTIVSLTAAVRATRKPSGGAAAAPAAQPAESRSGDGDRASASDGVAHHQAALSGPPVQPLRRPAAFEIGEFNRVPVVAVSGDLDITGAEQFRSALERAARTESAVVVVSLAGASYMDSHSIRALYQFGRRLATNRRALVLAVPSALPFERILDVSGLTRAFRVETSLEHAVSGVAGPIASAPAGDNS